MMVAIYVVSPVGLSGKTTIITFLASKAVDLGKKIGYLKPIGVGSAVSSTGEMMDEDVLSVRETFGLMEDPQILCPVVTEKTCPLIRRESAEVRRKIAESYRRVSEGKDVVLIEGPDTISGGVSLGCSAPELAKEFGARIVIVSWVKDENFLDEILMTVGFCRAHGVEPLGVVLNRVPPELRETGDLAADRLREEGVEVLGRVPESEVLGAVTVREILETVGGKVIAGAEGMNNLVQTFLVGAMTMESAIKYFQRAERKLVIVGGDRTDIISAALETRASAIVLTGNLQPSVKILPRAEELKIPLILVPYDTYTTLQKIQLIVGRARPKDRMRLEELKRIFGEGVNWRKILEHA